MPTQNTGLRKVLKQLRLGVLAYNLYYAPKGFIKTVQRRGAINLAVDFQACIAMEKAAYSLPPLSYPETQNLHSFDIHFLTGKKFWYQTCFCAYSMAKSSPHPLRPIIYDDGSLSQKYQDEIIRVFPNVKIILKSEIEEKIDEYLPENRFPYLRERRLNYPNIKKLTDIHIASQGWKLVLDSDMLFFQTPTVLLDWLNNPQQPCHMVDVETSYGYSFSLMSSLAGAEIADLINVGICGLKSDDIDWEQLEYWCRTLIEQEGKSYYQEQALVAMLMAGKPCTVAPASEYVVMPIQSEVMEPKAVLHHYVADSKPWYFRHGWRHFFH